MSPGIVQEAQHKLKQWAPDIEQKARDSAKRAVQEEEEERVKSQRGPAPGLLLDGSSSYIPAPRMLSWSVELQRKALGLVPEFKQKIKDRFIIESLTAGKPGQPKLFTPCFPGTAETCGLPWGSRAPQYHLMDQNGCDENDPNVFLGVEAG